VYVQKDYNNLHFIRASEVPIILKQDCRQIVWFLNIVFCYSNLR